MSFRDKELNISSDLDTSISGSKHAESFRVKTNTPSGYSTVSTDGEVNELPESPTQPEVLYDVGNEEDDDEYSPRITFDASYETTKSPIGRASLVSAVELIERLIPTASFATSHSIPREVLGIYSHKAQLLREKCLRGAVVAFIFCGYPGKSFVYKKAKKMGTRIILIDSHDCWGRSLVDDGIAEQFIPIDTSKGQEVITEECIRVLKRIGTNEEVLNDAYRGKTPSSLQSHQPIDHVDSVCSFLEMAMGITAVVAERLSLPGTNRESVEIARNKYATRQRMIEYGVDRVESYLISRTKSIPIEQQLKEAEMQIGYPAVLKLTSGAASLGNQRVDTPEEMREAYNRTIQTLSDIRLANGTLVRRKVDDVTGEITSDGVSVAKFMEVDMVLEAYLDGSEVDIDVVVSDKNIRYIGITDNGPTLEPHFAESWACTPSLLPHDKQEELLSLARAATHALLIDNAILHIEARHGKNGACLLEVNVRMGGGPVRALHKSVYGVDLVVEQLLLSCGIPSNPWRRETGKVGAYYFVTAKKSGYVEDMRFAGKFIDLPKEDSEVLWFQPYVSPKEHLVGLGDGYPTWLGEILVHAKEKSVDRLLGKVIKLADKISSAFAENTRSPVYIDTKQRLN